MRHLSLVVAACVSISVLAALSACSAVRHSPKLDASSSDVAAQLVRLDEEWSNAAGKRDIDRVASFYAENAVAYPPNESVAIGRAAAKRVWASYLADPTFSISWKATHAEVSRSGELGFTAGTYEDSFQGGDGKLVHETGKFLCVWAKQSDGSWKAVHDMWNADRK